jgi:N-acetylglucosaminyldiphosphoundecaprenol N-acetyl-beta-D-mannosaminyltransferase
MAMSNLASGAVPPEEAVEYVAGLRNVKSIVFGASSKAHILQTKEMIERHLTNQSDVERLPKIVSRSSTTECQKILVHGIPVHCCSVDYALNEIDQNIKGPRARRYISITNTESMYFAKRLRQHLQYIEGAHFSFCDGIGVVIAARAAGNRVKRLNGPVLMELCCEHGVNKKWRHFFLGGKEGVADLLSCTLAERFPGMISAGIFCPPFRQMSAVEEDEMIDVINAAKPDLLWVGLGLLKQEAWIARHFHRLEVPWMIGVGAAFDFLAGTARRAPKPIRYIGMEWFYRLCFEPRMFMRNVRSYVFMLQAIRHELTYNGLSPRSE